MVWHGMGTAGKPQGQSPKNWRSPGKLWGRVVALGLGLGSLLAALPAEAARLLQWRFDRAQNRLEFTTDEAVQPTAQLLANPSRIVIDLPGTTLNRPAVMEAIGGGIQNLRVAQFTPSITRLVLELDPTVTFNPRDIRIQGISPTQWVVVVPELRLSSPVQPPVVSPGTLSQGDLGTAATLINGWRETPDGLYIPTQGAIAPVTVRRSRDRRSIEIDVPNAAVNPALLNQKFIFPRLGVEGLQFTPLPAPNATTPPQARITLQVLPNAPNWQASFSNLGGIILLPQQRPQPLSGTYPPNPPQNLPPRSPAPAPLGSGTPATPATGIAQIQGISLDLSGTQILIQSDRPYNFNARPQGREYRVILSPAQLAPQVQGPQLGVNSLINRVRLRQDDPQTVSIFLEPAPGVQIEAPRTLNSQVVSLALRGSRPGVTPPNIPPVTPPPNLPDPGLPPSPNPSDPIVLPPVSRRAVVVIDPGHGGRDPGAVGRGGLQEKEVVFPIAQDVAALLTQQGLQVIMTRYDDREVDLEPRVQVAEQANATVFVSIHANAISLDRPEVNGAETYHSGSPEGRRLAQFIQQSLLENLPVRDRQVREARFYVIRRTSMPAALVEVGFVTGAEDAPMLADPAYRRRVAQAIAQGILRYLQ